MLRDEDSSKYQLYMEIARLLVLLGLYRPAVGFWVTLLDTLQWSTGIHMANPMVESDVLMLYYSLCRASIPAPADLPVNYLTRRPRYWKHTLQYTTEFTWVLSSRRSRQKRWIVRGCYR